MHPFCSIISFFFFSSRRRHTRFDCDWSSDVCSSDLIVPGDDAHAHEALGKGGRLAGDADVAHAGQVQPRADGRAVDGDRKSTRLNSSHSQISYAVFCLKKKKKTQTNDTVDYRARWRPSEQH